jgi:hypothetical protein
VEQPAVGATLLFLLGATVLMLAQTRGNPAASTTAASAKKPVYRKFQSFTVLQ